MRTSVVIDEALIVEAMRLTGLTTRKAVIDEALRTLVRLKAQEEVRSLRGKLRWEGELDAMREGRITADGARHVDR
jgi:Arc/MetJ family transcription regulator